MDIWELDKFILFLLFVIPGFVSIKAYQLTFPGTVRPTSDQLIDAVAYSSINYAILFYPIIQIEQSGLSSSCPWLYYFLYLGVFFIAPVTWVFLWKYIRTRDMFQKNAPHPTEKPWDYVFGKRKPYWVKVKLKSGEFLAGRYGADSFTSSSPSEQEIFLEECWILKNDGTFERKKSRTSGVLITSGEISYIEFRH